MSERARSIIEGAEIPSVPHVLQRILALASDPNSSARDLEQEIQKEPGLVAHLLKTVNSAYYAFPQRITSVRQAVVLLGFSAVRSTAAGLALIDAFNNLPGLNKRYVLQVWEHSLCTAGLVQVLARGMPRERRDALFLTAMVHNVGHLVLAQYFLAAYEALIESDPFPEPALEQERFQVDHAQAGAALLASWRFGEPVVSLTAGHHAPAGYGGEPGDVRALALAEGLFRGQEADAAALLDQEAAPPHIRESLDAFGWTWQDLRDVREDVVRSVEAARQIIAD